MITVSINNEKQQLVQGCTVADMLGQLGFVAAKVAVAVNAEFVPRSAYADCVLNTGDSVDVLAPVQGG